MIQIKEEAKRKVVFEDIVNFVDKEVRKLTDPTFGKLVKTDRSGKRMHIVSATAVDKSGTRLRTVLSSTRRTHAKDSVVCPMKREENSSLKDNYVSGAFARTISSVRALRNYRAESARVAIPLRYTRITRYLHKQKSRPQTVKVVVAVLGQQQSSEMED